MSSRSIDSATSSPPAAAAAAAADEASFMARLDDRMAKVLKTLQGGKAKWSDRFEALVSLEKLVVEGGHYKGFKREFATFYDLLSEPLKAQVKDLRSELVRQATHTIVTLATVLGDSFKRCARRILPALVRDVATARNGIIRNYGQKCVHPILQNCHSKGILLIVLDELNSTKDKVSRQNCMDFLRTILSFWTVSQFQRYDQVVQEAIIFGLKCPSPQTRSLAAKCFWLFVGHFPEQRERFLSSLDPRTKRIVERGQTIEDEEQQYHAATKIQAVMRGSIARRRISAYHDMAKDVKIGDRVQVGQDGVMCGVVQHIGPIDGQQGLWYGVELDKPVGTSDGSFGGKQIFHTDEKRAVFVRKIEIRLEGCATPRSQTPANFNKSLDDDDDDDDAPEDARPRTPRFPKQPQREGSGLLDPKTGLPSRGKVRKLTGSPLVTVDPETGMLLSPQATPENASRKHASPSSSPRTSTSPRVRSSPRHDAQAQQSQSPMTDKDLDEAKDVVITSPSRRKHKPMHLATPKQKGHGRQPSVPAVNERDTLIREHRFHISLTGAFLEKEMDLLQRCNEDDYAQGMLKLLDEHIKLAKYLRVKYADFIRRSKNQVALQDEFLNQMDNF